MGVAAHAVESSAAQTSMFMQNQVFLEFHIGNTLRQLAAVAYPRKSS